VLVADFNHEDFQQAQQQKMDEGLLVKFFVKPFHDKMASQKEGRPVYRDVEYIDIKIPGERGNGICRPAKPRDIARFPRHYEAFKRRTSQELDEGTPLTEWASIGRSQAEELAFYNVKTVEQLASVNDVDISGFMGGNMLKAKAIEWLAAAEEGKKTEELRVELAKRDDEIAELKAAVKALQAKPKARVSKKKATRKKKVSAKKE
jgi:hypothetical protein